MAKLATSLLAAFAAVLLALAAPSLAGDPDMLQDICVADYKSLHGPLRLNGFPCKRPENVTAEDFFSGLLANPGNTGNAVGSAVTAANVEKLPGLNTLGVSMARIDFAPWGINPPHTHPRATEVIFVLQGSLDVGFITAGNKLYARTVCKGEVFVFPRGLVHYKKNNGNAPAAVITAFNSQLPGTQAVAETLFGASPAVPTDVLARAFHLEDRESFSSNRRWLQRRRTSSRCSFSPWPCRRPCPRGAPARPSRQGGPTRRARTSRPSAPRCTASGPSVSLAFVAAPAAPGGWVAWGINPDGTGMVGAQALLALAGDAAASSSAPAVRTYNITSYAPLGNASTPIAFPATHLAADVNGGGKVRLYATLRLDAATKKTVVNHVWQVGSSVTRGAPNSHAVAPENLAAMGRLVLSNGAAASVPAPAGGPSVSGDGSGGGFSSRPVSRAVESPIDKFEAVQSINSHVSLKIGSKSCNDNTYSMTAAGGFAVHSTDHR